MSKNLIMSYYMNSTFASNFTKIKILVDQRELVEKGMRISATISILVGSVKVNFLSSGA